MLYSPLHVSSNWPKIAALALVTISAFQPSEMEMEERGPPLFL